MRFFFEREKLTLGVLSFAILCGEYKTGGGNEHEYKKYAVYELLD